MLAVPNSTIGWSTAAELSQQQCQLDCRASCCYHSDRGRGFGVHSDRCVNVSRPRLSAIACCNCSIDIIRCLRAADRQHPAPKQWGFKQRGFDEYMNMRHAALNGHLLPHHKLARASGRWGVLAAVLVTLALLSAAVRNNPTQPGLYSNIRIFSSLMCSPADGCAGQLDGKSICCSAAASMGRCT